MEQLIKQMAAEVIAKLDDLKKEADFERLIKASDPEIRNDAIELYQGINKLREQLMNLQ
jgi:uncharacterized protein YicC (UPF0701 family)